ncbi:MAG TPA: haloacid dehalogenase-like hydrolase [Gemmatimonadaceae bacterium]
MAITREPPLCVDLDGTLIAGDTLVITVRLVAARRPWLLAVLPFVLLRGRPALKRFLSSRILPDPATLPWRTQVVGFVREERARGREVCLVTAADRLVAQSVADFLPLFDRVIATDEGRNLKGSRKLAAIRKALLDNEFDYMGDSYADLPVFAAARTAYLVAPSASLCRAAESQGAVVRIFA